MAQLSIPIPDEQISSAVMEVVKKLDLVPREDLRAYCPRLMMFVRTTSAIILSNGSAI